MSCVQWKSAITLWFLHAKLLKSFQHCKPFRFQCCVLFHFIPEISLTLDPQMVRCVIDETTLSCLRSSPIQNEMKLIIGYLKVVVIRY